jgi:class 3 adenylate cyclase/tetratricopeptide (TPR) repeat protein
MQCPQCQHENPRGAKFCLECGGRLAVACGQCGVQLPPGAKFCLECGASLAASDKLKAESQTASEPRTPNPLTAIPLAPSEVGERRQVTVLFCDLVGSTDIASQLDPEEWHRMSKEYQQATAAAVTRMGGHVDKFLGDGLVCFFGVPQAHEDDAERAVRAGLLMVAAVQGLNGKDSAGIRLQVRVGIHTGSAVVAHGGGASQDVFGDTPNIAARVQAAAEPDTVLMTAATQRLVAGLFIVEERGAERLKGVPEPVTLYRVVQASGVRSRLEVTVGRHTPFVGRQAELGVLMDAWERVVEGMGQTVLVQGEPGVGKSRLCYELRKLLARGPHTWLECRCSPYTSGTAFRPIIELVQQALSFQPADTPADKLEKLTEALERGGFAADEALPLLAEWLELPERAGWAPLQMNPDVKRRRTLAILAAWSLKLGELQPTVLLVEDLHWCDPSSLELLARLVAQSATARVLLVGTARPEFASPWQARSNLQTVTLARFTKRQMRELIVAVSETHGLPETIVEQLVTRADGIPLFAEELTQAVVEARGDAGAAIPVTLQDSLLARLDRLSSAKEVAQRAAVLGRDFSYALLAATGGLDEGTLQQGLARLVEAELVFARGEPPEATYTFKHALVQEAAYESLLKRTRQQLHSRVVDVLVAGCAERAAAAPEEVARHAELAARTDDAITYHRRAGEQAQARSANEEAIAYFRKALALLATLPAAPQRDAQERDLHLALGPSLIAARGYAHDETGAAFERALSLAESLDSPQRLATALLGTGNFHQTRGNVPRALQHFERALLIVEPAADDALRVAAHQNLASALVFAGRFSSSFTHNEHVLALYDPARHRHLAFEFGTDQGVSSLAIMGWNLWHLGYPDQALVRAREAVALQRRLVHPFSLAFALLFQTVLHWLRREAAAQRDVGSEVMEIGRSQGFPLWLGLGRAFDAAARFTMGEAGAIGEVMEGFAIAGETGNQGGAPALLAVLAEAQQAAGLHADALGAVETALAVSASTGQGLHDADLHRLKAEILLATDGGAANAEALFGSALSTAREQGSRSFELRAATSLARLWRGQGKRAAARDLLAPVCAWFTEGFDTRDLIDAKALLERLSFES